MTPTENPIKIERKHLRLALRHVADGEKLIAKQKDIIASLRRDNHPTALALKVLKTMQATLRQMEKHLAMINERLSKLTSQNPGRSASAKAKSPPPRAAW
jgi:enoyl-CoA hydratase/carnithine racemase